MKTKKIIMISLTIAMLILLISIIAIVAVNAASNQNITSKIKVNFKPSEHVKAEITASYKFGEITRVMTTDGDRENNNNNKVTYNYNDPYTIKSLQLQKCDLKNGYLVFDNKIRSVVIIFSFKSLGASNYTAYLDVSQITKQENISLSYAIDNGAYSNVLPEICVEENGENKIRYCCVKIELEDASFDAKFEGPLNWNLVAEED